jgi:rSAM/selenodomain-associated transferase 1
MSDWGPAPRRPEVLVMAKAPIPGRAKTRLCPPLSPEQAAGLAEAALIDTLEAAALSGAGRLTLVLEGEPGPWLPPGFRVVPQAGGSLDVRLAEAFEHTRGPALLVGMDTPQLTPALIDEGIRVLRMPEIDAVLGPAEDGGWWIIGLRRADPRVFLGVPMSSPVTGEVQRERLTQLGLRFLELPMLRDVDRFEDALAVAELAPATKFARTLDQVLLRSLAPT